MKQSVIAIGLDSLEPRLVEQWMAEGLLPNFSRLREQGGFGRLEAATPHHKAETPWTTFLTSCSPQTVGYWGPVGYDPTRYGVHDLYSYDFAEIPPFYEVGDDYRVAIVDVPQTRLCDDLNGVQVLGWGSHSPQHDSASRPEGLLQELTQRHGEHPMYLNDNVLRWDRDSAKDFLAGLTTGVQRRAAICRDLLERERWDLFLTIFGEFHSAGHFLWHLSQPHPAGSAPQAGEDPLLALCRATDAAVGEIIDAAPPDATVVVFSAHGMQANAMDLGSNLFLPELLYRWSFPGELGLASPQVCSPLRDAPTLSKRDIWLLDAWKLRHERNPLKAFLRRKLPHDLYHKLHLERLSGPGTPTRLDQHAGDEAYFRWLPAAWYQPVWKEMRAFALPSFSDGYVRVNLEGREAGGVVPASEYRSVCEEICEQLGELRDARSGRPVVQDILWTRKSADEDDAGLPDADLIVFWDCDVTTDAVEHPKLGRIGPVPFYRTGGHDYHGFVIARGDEIPPGSDLTAGKIEDLGPTLLSLMGAPISPRCEGRPLVGTR